MYVYIYICICTNIADSTRQQIIFRYSSARSASLVPPPARLHGPGRPSLRPLSVVALLKWISHQDKKTVETVDTEGLTMHCVSCKLVAGRMPGNSVCEPPNGAFLPFLPRCGLRPDPYPLWLASFLQNILNPETFFRLKVSCKVAQSPGLTLSGEWIFIDFQVSTKMEKQTWTTLEPPEESQN